MTYFSPWDIIPILGIIAIGIAFYMKKKNMKREERELTQTLQSLESGLPAADAAAGSTEPKAAAPGKDGAV